MSAIKIKKKIKKKSLYIMKKNRLQKKKKNTVLNLKNTTQKKKHKKYPSPMFPLSFLIDTKYLLLLSIPFAH